MINHDFKVKKRDFTVWPVSGKFQKTTFHLTAKLKTPVRLKQGDYSDVIRSLAKVISKDTMVLLVPVAATILTEIIKGLRKNSETFSAKIVRSCLDGYKEKKTNIVKAVDDCIDEAMQYLNPGLSNVADDFSKSLESKVPSIRVCAAKVLTRFDFKNGCNKQTVKLVLTALCATSNNQAILVKAFATTRILGSKYS